ncbi:Sulfite reductase [nadph] hemoprotein beta-component [Geobacillus sp. WSUCF1]|nr:Sulfite reductase [nadph] hemoprotein beta-component [Geobacillus sp. WSUCF1]
MRELRVLLSRYAKERLDGEHFGDFVIRAGIVKEVTDGTNFHD